MKIWLYYAKSGGGHKAPAEALSLGLKKLYPGTETKLIDMAEQASVFFKATIEDGYVLLSHHLPWIYAIIYTINNSKLVISFENFLANIFIKSSIKSQLVRDKPDGIVATHFLVSPLCKALDELKLNIPIFILVTDPFSVSPVWFYNKKLSYIVFSETAKEIALKNGIPPGKVVVFKQIVNHPIENIDANKIAEIKNKYGISENKKTIVIIGGANGLPRGERIFDLLLKININAEILAICGDNLVQKENFEKIAKKYLNRAKILGWVDDLPQLIAAADLVISKAGAGVVWETILLKKPLLISHFIFGQEKGTMEFVVKNGLGWYETSPGKISRMVKNFIGGQTKLNIAEAVDRLKLRAGNEDIVNFIYRSITELKP